MSEARRGISTPQSFSIARHQAYDQHYADLVLQYLSKFGSASRKEIDKLLWDKLSDALDDGQKKSKIGNILTGLRVGEAIFNDGPRAAPQWKKRE